MKEVTQRNFVAINDILKAQAKTNSDNIEKLNKLEGVVLELQQQVVELRTLLWTDRAARGIGPTGGN